MRIRNKTDPKRFTKKGFIHDQTILNINTSGFDSISESAVSLKASLSIFCLFFETKKQIKLFLFVMTKKNSNLL